MQPDRVLVSGATGFIGSNLVRLLVESRIEVHAIARPDSDLSRLESLPVTIHFDDGEIALQDLVNVSSPHICFHLAGHFVGNHNSNDIERLVRDNLLFGTRLIDAIANYGGCSFVTAGSYWQHYGGSSYHPVALYAAMKQAFEDIVQYYVEANGIRATTLKFFETYGNGDSRPKLVSLLLAAAATDHVLGVSAGEQLVDVVHVADAARACLAAAEVLEDLAPTTLTSFSVSSGSPIRVRELVERIGRIIDKEIPVEWGVRDYRWREMMEPWVVAPPLPNWAPRVTLDAGISAMWREVRASTIPKDGR